MTDEQLIEELLLEAAGLGIKQDVLDSSEKYLDQGLERLEALELAFNDLTDDNDEYLDSSDIDWSDEDDDWSEDDDEFSDEDE
jgi:hypothetical protein